MKTSKKILYNILSIGFFVILAVFVVLISDTIFNNSSSFFDRFNDIESVFTKL